MELFELHDTCTRSMQYYSMHYTCSLSLLEDESYCALYSTVRRTNTLSWEILTALGNTPLGLTVCSLPARQPACTSSNDLCNQPNIKEHEVNAAPFYCMVTGICLPASGQLTAHDALLASERKGLCSCVTKHDQYNKLLKAN